MCRTDGLSETVIGCMATEPLRLPVIKECELVLSTMTAD